MNGELQLFLLYTEQGHVKMEIVFSSNKTIDSWLVRTFTKSKASHVSLRFSGDESKWMVDATPTKGVWPGWWDTFTKKNKVVARYGIRNIDEEILENITDQTMDEMVGKGFDYFGVIGLAIVVLVKLIFKKDIKNFLGSNKVFFCTEFLLKFNQKIKECTEIEIYTGDLETTVPQDLLTQSKDNPNLEWLT